MPAVEARGLGKSYGDVVAVRDVDLDVFSGEIFGFLGSNGAGKSTTIGMLTTLVEPSTGTATVAGRNVVRERAETRRRIGLVFQDTVLDAQLTVERNLRFHAEMYGMPRSVVMPRVHHVLDLMGLTDRRRSKVKALSGGMRRRVEIARGLLHTPQVLFLDEPTVGLDPQSRRHLWECIRRLREAEGLTVFLTTHYLDEAEVCDRIAIMDRGSVVAVGTPAELKADAGSDVLRFTTSDVHGAVRALHERFGLCARVDAGGGVIVQVPDGATFLPRLARDLGVPVLSMELSRPSLDDVLLAWADGPDQPSEAGALPARETAGAAAVVRTGGRLTGRWSG
ncbi:ABC transporter ATP-binding protein [Streptomyces sp. WAC06614]|uniref:ABC transporter ATP-binding protein n=1 Tax=Streptomyces sp. WAC06614 TaxID=2487416 RepID=UPI000F792179|nr:ABC transporter ATP-binding protein [Streptomyces sp. WAC06614]RSS81859.1 ABC transporter ATP-binding protein [Streptomyces sp. WAC06614]